MCIVFFAIGKEATGGRRLVLAANRDEFFKRPTAPASFWSDAPHVLGGVDMEPGKEGGSWLALNKHGSVCFLTNYREPNPSSGRGRGSLVREFVLNEYDAEHYASHVASQAEEFSGFNLVMVDAVDERAAYVTNRQDNKTSRAVLGAGVYGVSNGVLDDPTWPKVQAGRTAFAETVTAHEDHTTLSEALFELMGDRRRYDHSMLPKTGLPQDMEHLLSSIFVHWPERDYGTRSTAVLVVDADDTVFFEERYLDPDSDEWHKHHWSFPLTTVRSSP